MKKNLSGIIILLLIQSCSSNTGTSGYSDSVAVDTATVTATNLALESSEMKELSSISSEKSDLKNLISLSKKKKDEFSNNTYYLAKSTTQFVNSNSVHAYIGVEDKVPALRFCMQYHAEDWLFIKKAIFNIDGNNFEYYPSDMSTDNGDGYIWEWCDESVGDPELSLLVALANAKQAKVKYVGSEYYNVKTIPTSQLKAIKHTLKLYKAFLLNQ